MTGSLVEQDSIWFVCKYCKRAFPHRKDLVRHKRETHADQIIVNSVKNESKKQVLKSPPINLQRLSNSSKDESKDTNCELLLDNPSQSREIEIIVLDDDDDSQDAKDSNDRIYEWESKPKNEQVIKVEMDDEDSLKKSNEPEGYPPEPSVDIPLNDKIFSKLIRIPDIRPKSARIKSLNLTKAEKKKKLKEQEKNCDQQSNDNLPIPKKKGWVVGERGKKMTLKLIEQNGHNCSSCPAKFDDWTALQRHMWTHKPPKPYICSYCQQSFKSRANLKFHLVIHTGERAFRCDSCQASFTIKNKLTFHKNRFHQS